MCPKGESLLWKPDNVYYIISSGVTWECPFNLNQWLQRSSVVGDAWECALQAEMDAAAWESCQILLNI